MNEETNKPLDDKKKTALLRYITILFAAAFVIVLLSMLSQIRNSEATISELSQSSISTLQKAEQLQDTNRQLQDEKEDLQEQIALLEEQLAQIQADQANTEKTREAYELLLTAMDAGHREGNVAAAKALENLKNYESYLGPEGLKIYESLLEEGE